MIGGGGRGLIRPIFMYKRFSRYFQTTSLPIVRFPDFSHLDTPCTTVGGRIRSAFNVEYGADNKRSGRGDRINTVVKNLVHPRTPEDDRGRRYASRVPTDRPAGAPPPPPRTCRVHPGGMGVRGDYVQAS